MDLPLIAAALFAALVACGAAGSACDDPAPRVPPAAAAPATSPYGDRADLIAELRDLLLAGIATTEPSHSFVRHLDEGQGPPPSLFTGSYDWHSCVFAHWALLVIARTTGDRELSAQLVAALTPPALAREAGYLRAVPAGQRRTDPYDRAWLLRLIAELERHAPADAAPLRALRAQLEAELLDWLDAHPFPEREPGGAGGRRFIGYYQSWLFTWLQLALAGPTDDAAAARLDALHTARIVPQRAALAARVAWSDYDFLWLPSLRVLVDELGGAALAPLAFEAGEPIPLPERLTPRNVHPLGIEVARLWGFGALAARGDADASAEFDRRLDRLLARDELWRDDFDAVTHWVPQFLFTACWLRAGRP